MTSEKIQNLADDLEKNLKDKKSFNSLKFIEQENLAEKTPEILEIESEIKKVKPQDYQSDYIKKSDQLSDTQQEYQTELDYQKNIEQKKKNKIIQKFISAKEKMSRPKTVEAEIKLNKHFNEATQEKFKSPQNLNLSLIRRPVIYLIAIEMLVYFFSIIPSVQNILLNIILPLIVILDILVFVWLYLQLIEKEKINFIISNKLLFYTGFLVGLGRAIFKIIWLSQNWTIINLIIESLLTALIAWVIALIAGIFVKNNKRLTTYN